MGSMATEISSAKNRQPPHGFMTLLSSAACEWFLIFLIYVEAALSYLLVKFAQYCDLKEPCPLCSRLDHIFEKKKPGSYYSLLCSSHKEELSSLVPCSVHDNFADIHSMCEECLLPLAMQKKSSSESNRLLAGKLCVDIDHSVLQHLVQNKYVQLSSSGPRTCMCCNKTWRSKSNAKRLLDFTPVGLGASKANVKPPLPRVPGRSRFSRRDSLKRLREKFTGPLPSQSAPLSSNIGTLSHVGYSKLKIASDSESEFPFSEDDDDANTVCSFKSVKSIKSAKSYTSDGHDVQLSNKGMQKKPPLSAPPAKKPNQDLEVKPVIDDQPNLLDLNDIRSDNSSSSDGLVEHGLSELNWAEYYQKPKPAQALTAELISLDDGPQLPNAGDSSNVPSVEAQNTSVPLPHMSALSVLSELLSLGPSLSNAMTNAKNTINVEVAGERANESAIKHTDTASSEDAPLASRTSENADVSVIKHTDAAPVEDTLIANVTSEERSVSFVTHIEAASSKDTPLSKQKDDINQVGENGSMLVKHTDDASSEDTSFLKQNDLNLADPREVEKFPGNHETGPIHVGESSGTEDGTKILSHGSTAGLASSGEDSSPKANKPVESRYDEESSSHVVLASGSLPRNASSESFDGMNLGYVEGESNVDKLKQHMNSLYVELEEERNAAAIAANEAMAMITRLQEEKATLHMEALQYLRMMEEQAEYDMEALQKANELLSEKEKEVQDLEFELEFYRNNSIDELGVQVLQTESWDSTNNVMEHTENNFGALNHSKPSRLSISNGNFMEVNSTISSFEDERLYILQALRKLEEQLHQSHYNRILGGTPIGRSPKNGKDRENGEHVEKVTSLSNGYIVEETTPNGYSAHETEHDHLYEKSDALLASRGEGSDAIMKEIEELNCRLKALEVDQDFLNHASGLLQHGEDGLNLFQEVAHQLQELRKLEFSER